MQLDIDTLEALRRQHPAWRLLVAESAALVARELLADFRKVEQNFRTLDRRVRDLITSSAACTHATHAPRTVGQQSAGTMAICFLYRNLHQPVVQALGWTIEDC